MFPQKYFFFHPKHTIVASVTAFQSKAELQLGSVISFFLRKNSFRLSLNKQTKITRAATGNCDRSK